MKHLILLAFLAGCGGPPTAPYRPTEGGRAPAYDEALPAWTRKAETYEDLESRVFVRATWFSPAFASAFSTYRAERLGMAPTEAEAERAGAVAAAETELKFFVSVVTNDPFWNDLDAGLEATLRARLMGPAEPAAPTRIIRLTDDQLADLRPFFPYADPLSRAYWITFPMPAEGPGKAVHLRISGPPAIVDMRWEVR